MNEEPESRKQARRGRAEIEAILSDFRGSGLTQVAFARERNLNLGTFRGWLAKQRGHGPEGFCSVTVGAGETGELTIRLPDGIEVAVGGRADPQWVAAVVKGLGA